MTEAGIIVAAVAIIVIIYILEVVQMKKKQKMQLKQSFGQEPEGRETGWEEIVKYYEEMKSSISMKDRIDHITWNDLEMGQLYRRLNSCCSYVGEQVLYTMLHRTSQSELKMNQLEQYCSLATKQETKRYEIQLLLSKLGKRDESFSLPYIIRNLDLIKIDGAMIYRLLQGAFVVSFLPSIFFRTTYYLLYPLVIFLINLTIYTMKKMQFELQLTFVKEAVNLLVVAKKLQTKLPMECQMSSDIASFDKISKLAQTLLCTRQDSMTGDIVAQIASYLRGATLIDFTMYDSVYKQLKQRKKEFLDLYEEIGFLDASIAIASFRKSIGMYTIPTFDKTRTMRFTKLYHPLVKDAVTNSATIDSNWIITGSNASGKSTFIKAVAINAILAQTIHTCMAEEMIMPRMNVITSMAVRDDVISGESYYIKEIKYLNRIISSINEERISLCIIDEILRGTNTRERIAASAAILSYMAEKNSLSIVASHDKELVTMLQGSYKSYHFSELIGQEDIIFDYKLKKGPSNSSNAIRLLEYVGFPNKIIKRANDTFQSIS